MDIKNVYKKIDSYKNYIIALQTGMISRPAIAPDNKGGTGEYDKAVYLESELKKLKFDKVYRIDAPDKRAARGVRPNVVALYEGKDKSRTFWLMSHLDVVPAGDLKLWKTDPFKAVVKGDNIYGRGSEDNNQGLVSSLLAVRALMELGVRPAFNIGLLLVSDEEINCEYGIRYVIAKNRSLFGKKDIAIAPDHGDSKGVTIEVAEKAGIWLRFEVQGKEAHGSMPAHGNNAVRANARLVLALDELYKKFPKKDKLFDPQTSTFEPTKIEGGEGSVNSIRGTIIQWYDARLLPSYKLSDLVKEVKKITQKVEKQTKTKIICTVEKHKHSPATDVKEPVVRCFVAAVKEVRKVTPKLVGIGGGTVAAYLRQMNMPTVVTGRLNETLHAPNENSSIKNTLEDAKVFAHVMANMK
jgi:succinyl-diaminopimelate desuccinylase